MSGKRDLWFELAVVCTDNVDDIFLELKTRSDERRTIDELKEYCCKVTYLIDIVYYTDPMGYNESNDGSVKLFNTGLKDRKGEFLYCIVKDPYKGNFQIPFYFLKKYTEKGKFESNKSSVVGFFTVDDLKEISYRESCDSIIKSAFSIVNSDSFYSEYVGDFILNNESYKSICMAKVKPIISPHVKAEGFDNIPKDMLSRTIYNTLESLNIKFNKGENMPFVLIKKLLSASINSTAGLTCDKIVHELTENFECIYADEINRTLEKFNDNVQILYPHYYLKLNEIQYAFPLYFDSEKPSCVVLLSKTRNIRVSQDNSEKDDFDTRTIISIDEFLRDFSVLGTKKNLSTWFRNQA